MEKFGVDVEKCVEDYDGDTGAENTSEGEGDSGFRVVGGTGEFDVAVEVVK